eukprot:COSAG06_NODE_1096_length_10720_cov_195.594521_2_plen_96_part_00
MHCKAPVWVKPNLGEAQLGHQASAEYKLRFCLHLRDVYFGAVYSAGSETERVALKNGQKLKTGRFKSSPQNTFLLPPNATRGTPSTTKRPQELPD